MSRRTLGLDERLHGYLLRHGIRESELLRRLRQETARLPVAHLQIAPEQGALLHLLVLLLGARRILEVGTFTGYSSLWMASALPPEGRLDCLDISEEWTAVARRYWEEAGLADRVRLHLAPAEMTLSRFLAEADRRGRYDLVFIDADKSGYRSYYEAALDLLRPGGVVAADNTLWSGRVADPEVDDPETEAIRRFDEHVHADERVDMVLLPVGDGLTLARKR